MNHAREIARLRQSIAMRPLRVPTRGGAAASIPAIYIVAGGQTIAEWGSPGIRKRTSALAASDLPPGTGGTAGVVTVAANPIPAGLPNGIGVAGRQADGLATFILHDSSSTLASDLVAGDVIFCSGAATFDVVVGAVTYRYAATTVVCRL